MSLVTEITLLSSAPTSVKDFQHCLTQVFSTFSKPRATFRLYQLTGSKVTNEGNLLKIHDNLLKIIQTFHCKWVHILLNNVLLQNQ
jgi:hypothetical protein